MSELTKEDTRSIQRALDATEHVDGVDPEALQEKIDERRQRLESLNDEVEEARQKVQDLQQEVARAEMTGSSSEQQAAKSKLSEAQDDLAEKEDLLNARAGVLQELIDDLEQKHKAACVRQNAQKAREVNDKAIEKMRELYDKVKALQSLNAEIVDLCEKADSIHLSASYRDLRGGLTWSRAQEVNEMFITGLDEKGRSARQRGLEAEQFMNAAEAMFEEGERQYWPSYVIAEEAEQEEETSFWDLFSANG